VFPRLLKLYWHSHTNSSLFRLFLSPTLRHCALNHCVLSAAHSDLKSIATCCPLLENFTIWTTTHTSDDLLLLSETIRSFTRLKYIICPALDSAAWNHLSNLSTLVSVTSHEGPYKVPLGWDKLNLAPFLNVTTLCFHVKTAAGIIAFIRHSELPSLKEFNLYVDILCWTEAEELFCALSQCKACETLEHIDILSYNPANERTDNRFSAIRHFICFMQLRTMRLSVHPSIYFDDNLLEAMSSWPHIRSLELIDPCLDPPTVTFRRLFTALRHCPRLHNLRIYMDAVNIDIDPKAESFRHTSLRTLHVGSSHIRDPGTVARIISSMLPCVSEVTYRGGNLVWDAVNRQLKSLRFLASAVHLEQ